MFETILAATDFSLASRRALQRAALLAKEGGGRLHVLHVLPQRDVLERLFHRDQIDHAALRAGAQRAMQSELTAIRSHTGVEAQSILREGAAQRAIMEVAEELSASLIVVGAHGERESGQGARMLGGTALKCFARTMRPLLFVRRDVVGNYYKLLAAVDDSDGASAVLAAAARLSGSRSICQALHVVEAPFADRLRAHDLKKATLEAYSAEAQETAERNLHNRLKQFPQARITPIALPGSPAQVLPREVRERQPDLVIVGKRRVLPDSGAQQDRYFGSVSLRVAFEVDTDVLLVP